MKREAKLWALFGLQKECCDSPTNQPVSEEKSRGIEENSDTTSRLEALLIASYSFNAKSMT